jgi:hypothetical protein
MVELQHSPLGNEEYDRRNDGVDVALWIFDATEKELFTYEQFAEGVRFCADGFRSTYCTSSDSHVGRRHVLFHCADGQLYESVCESAPLIEVSDGQRHHVRMLEPLSDEAADTLTQFFGNGWPLNQWAGMPVAPHVRALHLPVRVISEQGRQQVDVWHRKLLLKFPDPSSRTLFCAPPGAGKTTALVEAVTKWAETLGKHVLVITFNKANAAVLNGELQEAGVYRKHSVEARTLDSLCAAVCCKNNRDDLNHDFGICKAYFPKRGRFFRYHEGKHASDIVKFRLRHPRATGWHTCSRHRGFTKEHGKGRWNADVDSYPIKDIAEERATFNAKRYACDNDGRVLGAYVDDKYDVVAVDEMQDLIGAQELRLLFQTSRPVVLVGDPMQAVNAFRDDPPCPDCTLSQDDDAPMLPCPIEWYGTWRLDHFTVRFIEERFGKRMYSHRQLDDVDDVDGGSAEVHWRRELLHKDGTLVMCRSNRSVAQVAQEHDGMRIINGDSTAQILHTASNDKSGLHPMTVWAQYLKESGELARTIALLKERSVTLCEFKNNADMSAVSTVHQVKGFERDHCAVHEDLLCAADGDGERAIRFVAFTRHKRSLVVMKLVE